MSGRLEILFKLTMILASTHFRLQHMVGQTLIYQEPTSGSDPAAKER